MRVVAMVSGGKDSCYNMMQCVAEGHDIVALANLHPKDRDELDSYMYQTVGHMGIEKLAEAMGVPLFRMETKGLSAQTGKIYEPTDTDDEVEDLYNLLASTKQKMGVEAVAVGAIFSDYQRVRVENVCIRLGLVPLAYLWRRDQSELLQEMIDCQVYAIIIKVASLGLVPDRHLGKSLRDMQPHLLKMKDKYGLNVCGEGGEYETFTLNCPLFKQQIVVDDMQTIISSSDPVCPVGYINFTKLRLVPKDPAAIACEIPIKTSLDYLSDLKESSYNDLSDPDLSETELEQIEMENRLREAMTKEEIISHSRSNSISLHHSPKNANKASDAATAAAAASAAVAVGTPNNSTTNANAPTLRVHTNSCSSNPETAAPTPATSDTPSPPPPSVPPHQLQLHVPAVNADEPIRNAPNAVRNTKGWLWLSGLQGDGCETAADGMCVALERMRRLLAEHAYTFQHVCYVTLYVRDMSAYAPLNRAYARYFNFTNPPTRVCVECPLPRGLHVIVEAVAYRPTKEPTAGNDPRHTMHVQGISHWAPANIGPYSQSTRVGQITYVSGQIGLVPGSMLLMEGGIKAQCQLALRHVERVAKAMNALGGQLRDVVQGICFVTHPSYISEARRQWERRTANAIVDYIVLPALPRGAAVEWQVWAHTHNDKFDYEETGCSVDQYTVFSRRRWNYESNCAAIVCYASTGLATSTTQLTDLTDDIIDRHSRLARDLSAEHIEQILTYTLNRILRGHNQAAVPVGNAGTITVTSASSPLATTQAGSHTTTSSTTPSPTSDAVTSTVFEPTSQSSSSCQATTTRDIQSADSQCGTNNATTATTTMPTAPRPVIHFKIFYQVNAAPPIDLLIRSIDEFREKTASVARFAYTVLPATSLQNFSTFLSICGIKHE